LNNVLGILISFDDPSRQVVRGIKVRKEKFLEKRLCISHLRQDHAISLLFPDRMFFLPAAFRRQFLPEARLGRLPEIGNEWDGARYRFTPGSNQSRRRADTKRCQSISAIA
jgi:hypothetical protein